VASAPTRPTRSSPLGLATRPSRRAFPPSAEDRGRA
jgi:hypothetical protein